MAKHMNRTGRLAYLTRNYKSTAYGGAKARVDIEDILASEGAVNLGLPRTFHRNKIVDYIRNLGSIIHFAFAVKKGDTVIIQYPVKKYYRFICRTARRKGARTISLIHDLGSFRRKRLTPEEEIRKLSLSDAVIAANENTRAWLCEHGLKIPVALQTAWDYLSDEQPPSTPAPADSCIFVGHLKESRNGFLYKFPPQLDIHLYGTGAPAETPANIHTHGFATPDAIISGGEGRYGLIWYGMTLAHDNTGYIGEYIGYCNPHKLGLYMLAGKPVIIWKGAGAAPFVEREGIGLTTDTLESLDRQLAGISEEQYAGMVANTRRVAARMKKGGFITDAIREAESLLEKQN